MNRVQEVVADWIGAVPREVIEAKESEFQEQVSSVQTEYEAKLSEHETQLQEIQRATEAILSDNRMLQRAFEDLDYLNLYDLTKVHDILPKATKRETILRLRQMRHENPLAKQGIRLITRFTLGKGIRWICKNDEVRTALNDFWQDEDNKVLLTSHEAQKEFLDEVATDGEKFLACFEAPNVKPYLKLAEIPMEEVTDIIYDPDNRRVPVYYKRKFKELVYDGKEERYKVPKGQSKGKVLFYRDFRISDERLEEIKERIRIPEGKIAKGDGDKPIKMMHIYVNPLWTQNGRRGISELFSSREWFRILREFMQDRAIINRAARAVAAKRKIDGGPAAVAQMQGRFGEVTFGQTDRESGELGTLSRPVAGAIYDHNRAVDLEWMKTDTGAPNAKEDARMFLMVGGAGIGTNIHYFGEGGDANLATAQAMELPMVKNYEDWQQWFQAVYMLIFDYVLHLAFGEDIPFETDVQEAVGEEVPGRPELRLIPGGLNGSAPARIELKPPEKTSVDDVVSWDFPPIITKDVVKQMTAWAQLTQQVAPGDIVVKEEAIKGALTVLGVPNVDQLMDRIKLEEERLQAERAAQQQVMMNNLSGANDEEEGGNVPGWTKAGSGADATTKRLAKGKPEPERNGRVAADARPGR